jgi:ribonuclease VapC
LNRVVLDSSAFLAYINGEPGCETVAPFLPVASISSVNACEIATKLIAGGRTLEEVRFILFGTGLRIVDFDAKLAMHAAVLILRTRPHGLSLGDRSCLALAARLGLPALTADRAWRNVDAGVPVQFIR